MEKIQIQPISQDAFAPFGDVLCLKDTPDMMINDGKCGRHHDLASLHFGFDARAGISLFDATPRNLPYTLDMVERHPEGSQAFIPMTQNPFLVIVAPNDDGVPGTPLAFLTEPGMGINFFTATWHGVLTPLFAPGLFAVVDRIGITANLEEHHFETPYSIVGDLP